MRLSTIPAPPQWGQTATARPPPGNFTFPLVEAAVAIR
jgi:hypothetical protein